jgi:hypothetical protein
MDGISQGCPCFIRLEKTSSLTKMKSLSELPFLMRNGSDQES